MLKFGKKALGKYTEKTALTLLGLIPVAVEKQAFAILTKVLTCCKLYVYGQHYIVVGYSGSVRRG